MPDLARRTGRRAPAAALAGSIGVILITGLYAAGSLTASVPVPPTASLRAIVASHRAGEGLIHAAGAIGLVADLLLLGGCAALALRTRGDACAFWAWLGLATLSFVGVDGLASVGFPPVLDAAGSVPAGYPALRSVFDLCFVFGVLAAGCAGLAAALDPGGPPALRVAAAATAAIALGAALLQLIGSTIGPAFGVAVGLAGVVGTAAAAVELRRSPVAVGA